MPDIVTLTAAPHRGWATLRSWRGRQWAAALLGAVVSVVLIAVPTDLVDTAWFAREVPPTAWAWPSLLVSSGLAGLLLGTYVAPTDRVPGAMGDAGPPVDRGRVARGGWVGSALTFFAVGCPVCNKIVLLALGYSGAMTWFAPLQPVLQAVGIGVLAWAVAARLRSATDCPVPSAPGGG